MQSYLSEYFYNPSATYLASRSVRQTLEKARASIAGILGARPAEVIFTSGATEANNLAVAGVARQFPKSELLVSAIEHDSVLAPASEFNAKQIPVTPHGIVDVAKLAKLISKKTSLVSVMLVNNELGTIQPIRQIAELVKNERAKRLNTGNKLPIYLHTDATQATNWLDIHVARLGVDLMTLNGGKIYGAKQTGLLFVRAGVLLKPLIVGGGQEWGLRSGTENVAGAIGLAKALEMAQANKAENAIQKADIRKLFVEQLHKNIPQAIVNGSAKNIAPHILSVTFPNTDNERLMMQLDEAGVQVAVGSACSASSDEPSHVLKAIGLSDKDAQSTLRFSFGRSTQAEDIEWVIKLLTKLVGNE